MLACARIGAVHSVVFGGFSAESLRDRINDSAVPPAGHRRRRLPPRPDRGAEEGRRRSGRRHAVDRARRRRAARRRGAAGRDEGRPRSLVSRADAGRVRSRAIPSRWTPRTCSTSSTPRARPESRRASSTPPAAIWSAPTRRPRWSSICARTTSTGAPPTSAGSPATATSSTDRWPTARRSLMYEGAPDWPQKDRFWSLIEQHGVTVFYTAPTAIRAFMRWGTEWPAEARSVVAAPARIGRRADQSRGVDLVSQVHRRRALPGRRHLVADRNRRDHDHAAARRHDAQARIGDAAVSRHLRPRSAPSSGEKVEVGGGLLALTRPWPSMLRGIYGDPDRYVRQYWNKWGSGVYVTGDGAKRDADGYFWLLGRVDDVHQRRRPSHRHDGGRERAGRSSGGRRSGGGRHARTRSRGRRSPRSSR